MNKLLTGAIISAGLLTTFLPAAATKADINMSAKHMPKHVVKHKISYLHLKGEVKTTRAIVVRNKPFIKAKIVAHMKKGTKLDIQSCDKFGWCKLSGKKEYVAGYALKKIK